jgi:uncharacterized protein
MRVMPAVEPLGVGLEYQEALRDFIDAESDAFDFVEVIPDLLWRDSGRGAQPRYRNVPEATDFIERVASRKPLLCHSIGLSIGSADHFETEHVAQIRWWWERFRFPWHSDHLAYQRVDLDDRPVQAGITMPLALDEETLELLVPRIRHVMDEIPVPFLLENNVYFFELPEADLDEPEFLNELARRSGCGLLLDVHNLYVNSRNHGIDAEDWLRRIDLSNVVEIHVAGGMEVGGFYVDAHSGRAPETVWRLLRDVLAGAPNVGAIVFELLGSWYETVGPDGLREELGQLREAWAGRVAAREVVPSMVQRVS